MNNIEKVRGQAQIGKQSLNMLDAANGLTEHINELIDKMQKNEQGNKCSLALYDLLLMWYELATWVDKNGEWCGHTTDQNSLYLAGVSKRYERYKRIITKEMKK